MGNIRNVYVKIAVNDDEGTVYEAADILSVNIQRSITDGSLGIGYTQSDRLTFSVVAADKLPRKTRTTVYTKIDSEEQKRLGRFYVEECTRDGSAINVTAYDAMYYQGRTQVKFGGKTSIGLAALTFPCTMQQMLDYICTLRSFSCDFTCQDFTVSKKPQKPDESYYTVRELLGYIAASHGCNAKFDSTGKLVFKQFAVSSASITASDATEFTLDDSEPYKVTGLLFMVDSETQIYVDDTEGSEYDEDDLGVIRCYNPLGTVETANYAWTQVGGLAYYGGSITKRGTGKNECGDVISVHNLKYPADDETYHMCITDISYSITAEGGFMETLSSQVIKESGISNGSVPVGGSSGGGDGVGRNVGQHNEIFNVNKGEPDSNTILLTSGDQNTARGKNNQMRGIAYQCEMTGLNNKILGWNYYCIVGGTQNQLGANDDSASHYSVIMYGYQNVFTGFMEYSFINGDSNRGAGANVFNSIISGNQNVVVTEGIYDSVLIGQQNRVNDVRRSFVGGSHNYVEDALDSIIVGLNNQVIQPQYAIVCGQGANGNIGNMYIVAGSVFTVDRYGAVKAAGGYGTMGADYAEMFEWADGNPANEDRRGMLVALSGDKIIPAHGDDFIGIISANPSVIGNNPLHWHGKYKTDVFGGVIYDDNGDAVLSEEYDPKREYIPRSERPEWAAVGLTGRLIITDNGSCKPNGYVSARNGIGQAVEHQTRIRVMRRIDDTHVEVLIR